MLYDIVLAVIFIGVGVYVGLLIMGLCIVSKSAERSSNEQAHQAEEARKKEILRRLKSS